MRRSLEEILDILGNETRREILQMLSEHPCYVSQLSRELNIGQKAIIEHLNLMSTAGILKTRERRMEKGRPRKYYGISRDFVLEVNVGANAFGVEVIAPDRGEDVFENFPRLKELMDRLGDVQGLEGAQKVREMERIGAELEEEKEELNQARKALEYLQSVLREEMRKEAAENIEVILF